VVWCGCVQPEMDPHPGFGPLDQALIDRLYTTKIHISRADRKAAVAEEYKAPEPPALDAMRRANKEALISRVATAHSHGLTIVAYAREKGVKDKKENALHPRGKSRNVIGGFFSS
jgi:hypothetical protein